MILKNRNHDEVADLARFALERDMDISFIEEMPLGTIGDHDRAEAYLFERRASSTIWAAASTSCPRPRPPAAHRATTAPMATTAASASSRRTATTSATHCNRVRVTSEGRLLLCLGQEHSVDLRRALRAHPDNDDKVRQAIVDAMQHQAQGT